MEYGIILNSEEIEELLEIEYSDLSDAIKQLETKFEDFDIKNLEKLRFMFEEHMQEICIIDCLMELRNKR